MQTARIVVFGRTVGSGRQEYDVFAVAVQPNGQCPEVVGDIIPDIYSAVGRATTLKRGLALFGIIADIRVEGYDS